MDTSELIKRLATDMRPPAKPLSSVWWWAVGISIAIALLVFFAGLGLRPDIAAAAETPRFLFKFLFAATLAAGAFGCVRILSRPDGNLNNAVLGLAVAPALLAMAVFVELFALSPDIWSATMIGRNSLACMTFISFIGLGPLAVFLWVLHYSAPTRPALAGSVAGLLAGGIAASVYAAHCDNDSPLFVATWYTLAIAGLAVVGAIAASRFARW